MTITRQSVAELLAELVRCPSVNPGDMTGFTSPYGEERLVRLLADKLESWGGRVRIDEVLPGRPNLTAFFMGRDTGKTILLDVHTDTVSHLGMTIEPFAAEVRDGRLYGRGACDTKASMAAMLLALRGALDDGGPSCNVLFAATCNEENGAVGARHLVETGIQADFAVIGEPTDLRIVTAHKGVLRARIATHGCAAHSSQPELGCNAIDMMTPILTALADSAKRLAAQAPREQLGTPTLTVTTIEGGTAINIIPESCTIQIDRRLLPGEKPAAVKRKITECIQRAAGKSNAPPSIEWIQAYPPLTPCPDVDSLKLFHQAVEKIADKAETAAVQYGTNAGFYAQIGIPSIVFGPGSIADAHTKNESVDLEEVGKAAEILYSFLTIG